MTGLEEMSGGYGWKRIDAGEACGKTELSLTVIQKVESRAERVEA